MDNEEILNKQNNTLEVRNDLYDSYNRGILNNEQFNSLRNKISIHYFNKFKEKISIIQSSEKNSKENLKELINWIHTEFSDGNLNEQHYNSLIKAIKELEK